MRKLSFFPTLFVIAILAPLIPTILTILSGNISFWYDPARDSLQALQNFHKFSLLGPTSGIPGVFYGPYWIWFLQASMLISKDPKIMTLFIAALPYFVLFPLTLLLYKKIFAPWTILFLWLLFVLGNLTLYGKSLWNPYPAPLLYLFTAFLFATNYYLTKNKYTLLRLSLTGFMVGLIANFHLSFGLGIIAGSFLFFIVLHLLHFLPSKNKLHISFLFLRNVLFYILGLFVVYIPLLLFEIKHQFLQTKAFTNAVTQSVIYHHPVVHQTGFSKELILKFFLFSFSSLLHLPDFFAFILLGLFVVITIVLLKTKQLGFSQEASEKTQLLLFLGCSLFGLITLYLLTSNPVWNYHYIGVDIVALLLIGFFVSCNIWLQKIAYVWVSIFLLVSIPSTMHSLQTIRFHDHTVASLETKEYIMDLIKNESHNKPFVMFAYSPSLYVFDYDYLAQWKLGKTVYYQPILFPQNTNQVFIILPKEKVSVQDDFIHYVTDPTVFQTEKTIPVGVDVTIVKRVKKG